MIIHNASMLTLLARDSKTTISTQYITILKLNLLCNILILYGFRKWIRFSKHVSNVFHMAADHFRGGKLNTCWRGIAETLRTQFYTYLLGVQTLVYT